MWEEGGREGKERSVGNLFTSVFCLLQFMFEFMEEVSKVMIVDFDAHQGNGHERDFLHDDRVYIMDMYNKWIYPNDTKAKGS